MTLCITFFFRKPRNKYFQRCVSLEYVCYFIFASNRSVKYNILFLLKLSYISSGFQGAMASELQMYIYKMVSSMSTRLIEQDSLVKKTHLYYYKKQNNKFF